ncbi:hypothetical protein [Chitinolyticbacter albus]|uniref:hypothetical protein n=1 Tax=Chitinolyticbacter albus TaxID=2961951 RepID=UPI00210D70FD|nr:hypothetical protein [Chitinolyticbacter albus]
MSLDSDLNLTYDEVIYKSPHPESIRQQQKRWLHQVRDKCATIDCLQQAYEHRIEKLIDAWYQAKRLEYLPLANKRDRRSRPFEGHWERCWLLGRDEVCGTYTLYQNGKRICGEWDTFATSTFYLHRIKADSNKKEVAKVTEICEIQSEAISSMCSTAERVDHWGASKQLLSICGNQLRSSETGKICDSTIVDDPYVYSFTPLSATELQRHNEPWLKRCLEAK